MSQKKRASGPLAGPQDDTIPSQTGRTRRMDPLSRRLLYLGVVIAALSQVLDRAGVIPRVAGDAFAVVGVLLLLICFIRVQREDKKPKVKK